MCWWIFGHCWHIIKYEKIRHYKNKDRCKRPHPFIRRDVYDKEYVLVQRTSECCLCGIKDSFQYLEYNVEKALSYSEKDGNELLRGVH
jgi:hypothetical protein